VDVVLGRAHPQRLVKKIHNKTYLIINHLQVILYDRFQQVTGIVVKYDNEPNAIDMLVYKKNMETKQKILLVDDETAIIDNLAPFLERAGFLVISASNGIEALQRISKDKPDILIMDVLMPKMDGREALRQLRRAGNWIPILLLTQVGESSERAMALEEGADDYLNKPFDPHELVARIRAILRRAKPGQPPISMAWKLISGPLTLDRRARRIYLSDKELLLTPKALLLLEYLMTHPDELVTRDRLLDVVWGWDYPVGTRAVDTRIAELRRALKDDPTNPNFIETVPGQGYRFIGELEVAQ
jgi:DNA-binding response OmpR family regulator